MARDLDAFGARMQEQVDQETGRLQHNLDLLSVQDNLAYQRQRLAGVRVTGVAQIGDVYRVVVDLGSARLDESRDEICRQSGRWLRRDARGEALQILERQRGGLETSIGLIRC